MRTEGTLVILTPGFASSEQDSTCLPMHQSLVRTFHEIYPDIKIIILSFQYPYHTKTYTWHHATVHCFNGRNRGGMSKLLMRRKVYQRLEQIKDTENIIGVFSFWLGECAFTAKKFCDANKLKHRCWLLGQDAKKENKYPSQAVFSSNELVALSDFLSVEYEKNFAVRPVVVIPASVNPDHIEIDEQNRVFDIAGAGSLIPLKQYDIFVEAVAEIKKQVPDVKAVLIGGGPERKNLEQLINRFDLADNIFLSGELSHNELLNYMQRSKIFLHPSRYEGFGVVCLEALYCGMKVISFVRPMNRPICDWNIVTNKQEMAEMAVHLLKNDRLQFQSQIVFDMRQIVKDILQLFVD